MKLDGNHCDHPRGLRCNCLWCPGSWLDPLPGECVECKTDPPKCKCETTREDLR